MHLHWLLCFHWLLRQLHRHCRRVGGSGAWAVEEVAHLGFTSRGRSRSPLSDSSLKRLPWESTPTRCTSAELCFRVGEISTGTLWLCRLTEPRVEVFDGDDQHCLSSCPSFPRVLESESASPPTPGALTPPATPRGKSLALGRSRIWAVPSSSFLRIASEGRAAPFSGCEVVEAVRSNGGLLRFLVTSMPCALSPATRRHWGSWIGTREWLGSTPFFYSRRLTSPQSQGLFDKARGKEACKASPTTAASNLTRSCSRVWTWGFLSKRGPTTAGLHVVPLSMRWRKFNPSVWGKGRGGPANPAVGSYFLWGWVSISGKSCSSWEA